MYADKNEICMDLRGIVKEFDCTESEKFRIFRFHWNGGKLLERLNTI